MSAINKVEQRFLAKTRDGPKKPGFTSNCLLWIAARTERGYGRFRHNARVRPAHRVAWELAHGETAPDHFHVLHYCDTPSCVNPGHLYLGTQRQNMEDRAARGVVVGMPTTIPDGQRRLGNAKHELASVEKKVRRLEAHLAWLKRTCPDATW